MRLIRLAKAARKRFDSEEDYFKFQQLQARWITEDIVKEISLKDKVLLDLGAGRGGYSVELAKEAKLVCALDLNNCFMRPLVENVVCVNGDAVRLPFKDDSFDFIFCSSLIEHIKDQRKLIAEIYRVLKANHNCYLSFPPFYSPVGGHQFKPFHLLGEENAIALSKIFNPQIACDFETSFGNWGLYPTTIAKIKKYAEDSNFRCHQVRSRFTPLNVARIPLLREFLTWHVEFIMEKLAP